MTSDEERKREIAIKGRNKEVMKKDYKEKRMKRYDKKSRIEDKNEEKIKQSKGERNFLGNEYNQNQNQEEKDSEIKSDKKSEQTEKEKKNDGIRDVEEKRKKTKITENVRKSEKDEKTKVEKLLAKNKDKIDDEIYQILTPGIAEEMKIRGVIFYETLGKGSFSTVKKSWCKMLNKMVAIKIIDARKDHKYTKKCMSREIELVQKLEHDNIIKVYEVVQKNPYVCIIQDFTIRGDLLQKIKRKSKVDENEGKIHFRQLIEAMKYLKSMEVVHRDIKCENILLDSCDNVKITDFGFARLLKFGEKSKTFLGSRAYLAPEIIRAQPYDGYLSDMWSAGVVLYVMTTGLMPYDDKNVHKMLARQLQHRIVYRGETEISNDAKCLIFDILHPIPHKRLTIEEVIKSKWLAGVEYRILAQAINDSATSTDSNDTS